MYLGYLIQFFTALDAVTDPGQLFVKRCWNSWVYRVVGTPPLAVDKFAYFNAFFLGFYVNLFNVFPNFTQQGQQWCLYPNTPGDVSTQQNVGGEGLNGLHRTSTTQAVFVNLKTSLRSRPYRGIKRFGPIATSDLNGDELTPAARAAWTMNLANITTSFVVNLAGGGTNTIIPVVWSRKLSATDTHVPPAIGADLIGYHVNLTTSSCRHRRERVVR